MLSTKRNKSNLSVIGFSMITSRSYWIEFLSPPSPVSNALSLEIAVSEEAALAHFYPFRQYLLLCSFLSYLYYTMTL